MPDPRFKWNERAGRYTQRGTFVSNASVRDSIDRSLNNAEREVRLLAGQLQRREISLIEWELRMRQQVKDIHLWNHSVASGGWNQMSPSAQGKVAREIRAQYDYLRNFSNQVKAGTQNLDGSFVSRASLYAGSGRKTFSIAQSEQMAIRGWTSESNIRYSGDSCAGCIEATAMGWVPIGTLPPPGTRDCLSRCRCRSRFLNDATGEVSEGAARRAAA